MAGMQPLLYSERSAQQGGNGWIRVGHNISYHVTDANHIPLEMLGKKILYTLTWTMVSYNWLKFCQFDHFGYRNSPVQKIPATWLTVILISILSCYCTYQS